MLSKLRSTLILIVGLSIFASYVSAHDHDEDDGEEYSYVTCGSSFRLKHDQSGYYVHSGGINWGSGSGQQAVTAFKGDSDSNSIWSVTQGLEVTPCTYGEPIACGSQVRYVYIRMTIIYLLFA